MAKQFLIHTKGVVYPVKASTRKEAYAKFFLDIKQGKIPLKDVGQIIILKDGKDEYPFRTCPSLWLLGIIDTDTAILNIRRTIGGDDINALEMLAKTARQDRWIIGYVKRLEKGGK